MLTACRFSFLTTAALNLSNGKSTGKSRFSHTPLTQALSASSKEIAFAKLKGPEVILLSSLRCDCGDQLAFSMALLQKSGGVLIYLRQEGRGIGLVEKLKAYNLQDAGQDTYEANVNLGHPEDGRTFEPAIEIIRHLGIHKIKVLTNNPEKVRAFDDLDDLEVVERVPLQVGSDPENIEYLEAKKIVKGHFFS